ncbi:winged helix-turn-helix transcriptional regulator [Candidatus Woesebacteria bacterium]|jgi:DNA-binding transcriptional ArsR family regulator|nr:winged helix-turn-helix transcriptional regulator [Candidatus Woesebacteria bacterium]MBP9687028.1 winged helix-turn-helix transcriptional regulator [Candidatus Woesebacteria bacterium]
MSLLSDIITSKVRIKILELLFADPNEMYHVRGIVREIKEEINAVRRELGKLEAAGIIKKESRGNRIYYWVRSDYPMYGDILSMVAKATGLGGAIVSNRTKLGKLNHLMFSGRFARYKKRRKDDDVDILVVGDVVLPELATLIRMEESKRGYEINYTVMGREELDFRKKRRDPFLLSILSGSRVMIIGDEETLVD